tara:strand:+ start:512 stop:3052 length:2541 start_codon:yes stop_codon:yes gene_type:complete
MRLFFLFIVLFTSIYCKAADKIDKTPTPTWVKTILLGDKKIVEDNVGYQYLLIDFQENLIKESVFKHYAVKILNSEGVQSLSDISVSYDPAYQKLDFHKIVIIRDGVEIEKLKSAVIQNIQRETNMERSLYDGSKSAIINLSDVRADDIIEYSYSVTGFNPVNKGHYATSLYQQYTSPVNQIYNRVITNETKPLNYKAYDGAAKPTINKQNSETEYTWHINGLEYKLYDSNVPYWYDDQKKVSFSTFNSWNDVVNWALPLYDSSDSGILLSNTNEQIISKEEKILKAIRLVQDDIRYLGFESGIGAYKPNSPKKVFKQRYGDCKDKSLLLVTLLRDEGLNAYPVFVNTTLQNETIKRLPSNTAFDHCIVNFEYEGKQYFIDPTIANQGGDLVNMASLNYKTGLRIKEGETDLVTIDNTSNSEVSIDETITIDSIGQGAIFLIKSTYKGAKADYMRSYFNTNSKEIIQREFSDFYSSLYPGIEPTDEVRFTDVDRDKNNIVTVEEYYKVNDFWSNADQNAYQYFEVYPLVLESLIAYPQSTSSNRTMPYYLGANYKFRQVTAVNLPEQWNVPPTNISISGDGFTYSNIIKGYGRSLTVAHNYELTKEVIEASALADFQKKHEEIMGELPYYLTYNDDLEGFKLSWISLFILFLAVGLGVFMAIRIYKKYNPAPYPNAKNLGINGWLILPAIGLTLTPFRLLYDLLTETTYYNANSWASFSNSGLESANTLSALFGLEIFYNYFFLVYTILLVIVFYQRKTSIPRLMTIFYVVNFLFQLLDTLAYQFLTDITYSDGEITEAYGEIAKALVGAAIWIPYFNISERVKDTFCKSNIKAAIEPTINTVLPD